MAAKRAKFLADIDAEMAKGFPAVTANKLKTDYGWQHADIKTISECLLLNGLIEPHEFTFKAGKGSPQTATGFRRPVPSTQIELQFPDEPVGNDQPVFSEGQPAQPADAGDGGAHHADEPVVLSPLKGDNHGQPADAHHPEENRKTNQVKPAKTGRRKKPADATMRGKRRASRGIGPKASAPRRSFPRILDLPLQKFHGSFLPRSAFVGTRNGQRLRQSLF